MRCALPAIFDEHISLIWGLFVNGNKVVLSEKCTSAKIFPQARVELSSAKTQPCDIKTARIYKKNQEASFTLQISWCCFLPKYWTAQFRATLWSSLQLSTCLVGGFVACPFWSVHAVFTLPSSAGRRCVCVRVCGCYHPTVIRKCKIEASENLFMVESADVWPDPLL